MYLAAWQTIYQFWNQIHKMNHFIFHLSLAIRLGHVSDYSSYGTIRHKDKVFHIIFAVVPLVNCALSLHFCVSHKDGITTKVSMNPGQMDYALGQIMQHCCWTVDGPAKQKADTVNKMMPWPCRTDTDKKKGQVTQYFKFLHNYEKPATTTSRRLVLFQLSTLYCQFTVQWRVTSLL